MYSIFKICSYFTVQGTKRSVDGVVRQPLDPSKIQNLYLSSTVSGGGGWIELGSYVRWQCHQGIC